MYDDMRLGSRCDLEPEVYRCGTTVLASAATGGNVSMSDAVNYPDSYPDPIQTGGNRGPRINLYSNWADGEPVTGNMYGHHLLMKTDGTWRKNDSPTRAYAPTTTVWIACHGICPPPPPAPPLTPCQDLVLTLYNPTEDWSRVEVELDGVELDRSDVSGRTATLSVCRPEACYPMSIVETCVLDHLKPSLKPHSARRRTSQGCATFAPPGEFSTTSHATVCSVNWSALRQRTTGQAG